MFGSLVLSEAELLSVTELGPAFRLLQLGVQSAAGFLPGDKVQIVLPSKDVRTYTPVSWSDGQTQLLIYLHAEGTPGTTWARHLAPGDRLRFMGPQKSLRMPEGRMVLVGDETSMAVAAAYTRARPGAVTSIFEVGEGLQIGDALEALGLSDALVLRRSLAGEQGALLDAVANALPAKIGITGSGALVQAVRAGLRGRGHKDFTLRTYWIEGKAGLD